MRLLFTLLCLLPGLAYAAEVPMPSCQPGHTLTKTTWGEADHLGYDLQSTEKGLQYSGRYLYRFNDRGDAWLRRRLAGEELDASMALIGEEILFLEGSTPAKVQPEFFNSVPRMVALVLDRAFKDGPNSIESRQPIDVSLNDETATRRYTGWAEKASPCAIRFDITYKAGEKGKRADTLQRFSGVWVASGKPDFDKEINHKVMERWFIRALANWPTQTKYIEMSKKIPVYRDLDEARNHARLVNAFGLDDQPKK